MKPTLTMFACKVKYYGINPETDKYKTMRELHFFETETFGEAEKMSFEMAEERELESFSIEGIRIFPVTEVHFHDTCDKWFQVRIKFISFDSESGKEIEMGETHMVQAETSKEVSEIIDVVTKDAQMEIKVTQIRETKIVNINMLNSNN